MSKNITYRVKQWHTYNDFDNYCDALEFAREIIDEYREGCKNNNGKWHSGVYHVEIIEFKRIMAVAEVGTCLIEVEKVNKCVRIEKESVEVDDYDLVGV